MAQYFAALNTVFFDDCHYPMLFTGNGSQILLMSTSSVPNLLGWAHAQEGEKAPSYQQEFMALGVQVSFPRPGQETFTFGNKPGRVEALAAMIQEATRKADVANVLLGLQGHL